jgi:Nucleotidyl transferase of unknown function (DUF2204)
MDSPPSNLPQTLLTALSELTQALDETGTAYALIGGLAAGYRSRPRFTQDVDLLVQIPQLILPGLLDKLQKRGFQFDTTTVIREWNAEHMTVLSFSGVRIDWLKPVLPCFQHVIDTAQEETWGGTTVRIASAEALVLMKLLSFRQQDLVDIESLLAANRGELDLEWIRRELAPVMPADDPRLDRFKELVDEFYLALDGEADRPE